MKNIKEEIEEINKHRDHCWEQFGDCMSPECGFYSGHEHTYFYQCKFCLIIDDRKI